MSIKEFIKYFIPPIYYKIRKKNNISSVLDKEVLFDYFNEISRRANISFDHLYELSENIDSSRIWSLATTSDEPLLYGGFWEIQKYINDPFFNIMTPKNFYIQHGFECDITDWMKHKKEGFNLVWSTIIRDKMKSLTSNSNIFSIGAPFFYSHSLLTNEQIAAEKKRLGHNLLAFPLHSTYLWDMNYNPDNFLNLLKELRSQFDSIRVCLYWKDVQRGMARVYQDEGFECVCCGHLNDLLFLSRQNSLFQIADATISNGIGSYIGYSVWLNKPHWLVSDKFEIVDVEGKDAKAYTKRTTETGVAIELRELFADNKNFVITDQQRRFINNHWGVSEIKSPKELGNLIRPNFYK